MSTFQVGMSTCVMYEYLSCRYEYMSCRYEYPSLPNVKNYLIFPVSQCVQNGLFLKDSEGKLSYKSTPIFCQFLSNFGKMATILANIVHFYSYI